MRGLVSTTSSRSPNWKYASDHRHPTTRKIERTSNDKDILGTLAQSSSSSLRLQNRSTSISCAIALYRDHQQVHLGLFRSGGSITTTKNHSYRQIKHIYIYNWSLNFDWPFITPVVILKTGHEMASPLLNMELEPQVSSAVPENTRGVFLLRFHLAMEHEWCLMTTDPPKDHVWRHFCPIQGGHAHSLLLPDGKGYSEGITLGRIVYYQLGVWSLDILHSLKSSNI